MIHNVYYICFSVGKCMSLATQECPSKKVQRRGSGSISPLRRRTTDRLTTLDEELGFNSLPEVVVLFLTNCVLSTWVLSSPDLYDVGVMIRTIWMIKMRSDLGDVSQLE